MSDTVIICIPTENSIRSTKRRQTSTEAPTTVRTAEAAEAAEGVLAPALVPVPVQAEDVQAAHKRIPIPSRLQKSILRNKQYAFPRALILAHSKKTKDLARHT